MEAAVVAVLAVPVVLGALEVRGADVVAQVQEGVLADVAAGARVEPVALVRDGSRAAATSATSSARC